MPEPDKSRPGCFQGARRIQFSHFADNSGLSREEAIKRLSALEARVALSERTAGMGAFRWTHPKEMPDWTPGLYRILGLDPSKPPLKNALLDMAHPEDKEVFTTAIGNVMTAPGPFFIRYRIVRADGAERHIEVNGDVETDENGMTLALVGIVTDVTRRIETEDQLRSAMDAFRVLTEEANDTICRLSPDLTIQYISPAVTRMLGYDPGEMLGMGFADNVHPDDLPMLVKARRELMTPGVAKSIVLRMRHNDGYDLWVETVCRSSGDPETGRVSEIITVSRDVTARKTAELEITRARETAESANRTKSRFLATMSHELRTPLNAIIGFSDMIMSEMFGQLTSRYREYAELINESGALLLDLINDILDMSKIEAGRFELLLEEFDVAETVDSCARLLTAKAEQAGLTLKTDYDAPVNMEADRRAVKQILLNLMSNAIKFTPRGGTITLSAVDEGSLVRLSVIDTGVGIPATDLPRLGQPFEQATQDATLAKAGTGLGLALVRSLAQLHGGDLKIESVEGRGTTVSVFLPKTIAATAAQQAAA